MLIDSFPLPESIAPSAWDPQNYSELVCLHIHQETHDVKTFTFAHPSGKRFDFFAGQFFIFEVEVGGALESRCYSLSSSPQRAGAVSISVKRVVGGKVSNWLHNRMEPGTKVRARGPLGRFGRPEGQKLLFLSGGSGITPLMSMVRDLADRARPIDVVFLHAGRTPGDLVFREELTWLALRMEGLRLHFLPEAIGSERGWPGISGRISREFLALAVPDISQRWVMCCGPAPFMAAARQFVGDLNVPEAHYLEESFEAAAIEDAPVPLSETASGRTFKVEFAKQRRTIDVPASETVLGVAKRAGVKLPSSCCSGLCGTCRSKLVSGSVDMIHSGGIRQREIDAGWFLPCCSKPLSDLVIER